MVGGGVQSQRKTYSIYSVFKLKKNKRNLLESDSENEAAELLRLIVIESLEAICLAKFSHFASPKTVKKTRNGNLLVEVDSRRQVENILRMKTFHATKCRVYPHEKLNTPKSVIRSRELALSTEEGIALALGKQGVTNIRRIFIRKGEQRIQTNAYILTFNQPLKSKEVKIGYCLDRVEQYVPAPLRCFKCQKYGHHREPVEDDRHVPNAIKRTRITLRKIAWKKLDVQTADKIIRVTQDLALFTKKEKEIIEVKHMRNVSFPEAREIVGSYMGENRGRIERMKTTNIEHSWRNWSSWKPMIGQRFKSTWKNYTWLNFGKH